MSASRDTTVRSVITDDGINGFRITIPARCGPLRTAYLVALLCCWAIVELTVLTSVVSGAAPRAFVLVWLAGFTLQGLLIIYALCWNLCGEEVILIDEGELIVRRDLWVFQRGWAFQLAEVGNMRYAPLVYNPFSFTGSWAWQRQRLGVSGGFIALDYRGKTYRFGNGLEEVEARRLIATIRQIIPVRTEASRKFVSAALHHRVSIETDEITGFRIVIRGGPTAGQFWPLVGKLCAWTFVEATLLALAFATFLSAQGGRLAAGAEGAMLLGLVGLLPCTYIGAAMIAALLCHLRGPEVVLIDGQSLVLRRDGVGDHPRVFDLAGINDLRYAPTWTATAAAPTDLWTAQLRSYGVDGDVIAFEHGGQTHRLGSGLSEEEAIAVIHAITAQAKVDHGSAVAPVPVSA